MIKNRRASLNISINAIVIIVLAMTFLGLGLGFVRNMFGGITETTFSVQDQIKQQILDDLRTGDKKLSFPTNELKISLGESKVIAIGVKNTETTPLSFNVGIFDVTEGGEGADLSSADSDVGTFIWDRGPQELGINEAQVYPIKLNAGRKRETFIIRVVITDSEGGEYASKSFFVTVI